MNGIDYLADTNCFIYVLDEHPLLLQFAESRWIYSYITEMELLSKRGLHHDHEKIIRQMLATCTKYGHSQAITEMTIKLKRKYTLKLPDAIIAATAQYLNLPLLTADRGFAPIKEIDSLILQL